MKVLITGGAGFLGNKLAIALSKKGSCADATGHQVAIDEIVMLDHVEARIVPEGCRSVIGDVADPDVLESVIDEDTAVVFHLAAVVSGEAEENFDLGMRVNLDATRLILERCRSLRTRPKVLFASSVAAFGPEDGAITGKTPNRPLTSYGTQKAIAELLLNDYARKGFIQGIAFRLPTVVVRPGRPNRAASSFASSILREPLSGQKMTCPVRRDVGVWLTSPRSIVSAFIHGADLDLEKLGNWRTLNLPGLTVSLEEMVEALIRKGGDANLISWELDPAVQKIVDTWPVAFETPEATALGFVTDNSIDDVIDIFLTEDL
ncbi:D-erythronate dehydrogenase [Pelagibius sp. Alg239-R121]|uniref:D-erythronate dehydrogenase n=1 Tax=Pelagibius sp. Alg239-R121 TaxID=2993448 RepID=UPI0024A62502|nr:D-erythronate dehydrogenase [Pelagibius sp. Alg239-R121]